ncbi:unnamed protein product [Symbiodinium natans]|uniref:Uncharacterized protein n=1 Tax=Symbiodinium natans TaxID=878477 RepID=A0A812JE73_9DINO|nr:unnamed protein product [Symbiodinium natans]
MFEAAQREGQDMQQQAAAAGVAGAAAIDKYLNGSGEQQALVAGVAAVAAVAAVGGSQQEQIEAAAAAIIAEGTLHGLTPTKISELAGLQGLQIGDQVDQTVEANTSGMFWGILLTAISAIAVILAVVCYGKLHRSRVKQAQALRQATEEAKLAERMQDNFDAARAKICVMLPKLEPGQGPPVARFQSVVEGKKEFNFADDVLPGEREAPPDSFRGNNWGEGDVFSLEVGGEVTSPHRNSTSTTGSRLPQSPPATGNPSAIQNDFWTAPEVGDDELPTIKPSIRLPGGGSGKLLGDDEFSVGKAQPPFSPASGASVVSPSGRRVSRGL